MSPAHAISGARIHMARSVALALASSASSFGLHESGWCANCRRARERVDDAARADDRRRRRRDDAQPAPEHLRVHRESLGDDDGVARQVGRAQPAVSRARDRGAHANERRRQQGRPHDHLSSAQGREVVGRRTVRRRRRRVQHGGREQPGEQRSGAIRPNREGRRARQVHGRLPSQEAVLAGDRDVLLELLREPVDPAQAPVGAVSEHQRRAVQCAAGGDRAVQVRALGPFEASRARREPAVLARPPEAEQDRLQDRARSRRAARAAPSARRRHVVPVQRRVSRAHPGAERVHRVPPAELRLQPLRFQRHARGRFRSGRAAGAAARAQPPRARRQGRARRRRRPGLRDARDRAVLRRRRDHAVRSREGERAARRRRLVARRRRHPRQERRQARSQRRDAEPERPRSTRSSSSCATTGSRSASRSTCTGTRRR